MRPDSSSHPRQGPSTSASTPTLSMGLGHHQAGRLTDAEKIYRNLILKNPDHADALHLLGMILHAKGQADEAERLIRRAILIRPNQAVYHSNLGIVLAAGGKLLDAIAAYRLADSINPKSPETLNNLGVALHATGEIKNAIDCFRRAVVLKPDYADAQTNLLALMNLKPGSAGANHALGDLLQEADRLADAVGFYRRAIELDPESAETHNNLGNALFATGEPAEALLHYQQALKLKPNFPQACNNLANTLKEFERLDEAIAAYQKAVGLQPNVPEPLSNLGNALRDTGEWDLAMACYQRAIKINPNHAITHNNIGNAWCERGSWAPAIAEYETALSINPDYADAINNLGTALEEIGQRDRAMQCYLRAHALTPKAVSPPWNIALLQLLQGDYENGWPGYENRWRQKKQCKTWRNFDEPIVKSLADMKGKRVLLHAEQGFGDAIQFCRYATLVAEEGATVFLECPAKLARIFKSIEGVTEVRERGESLPDFDLHCPLMSLPMIFETRLQRGMDLRVWEKTTKMKQSLIAGGGSPGLRSLSLEEPGLPPPAIKDFVAPSILSEPLLTHASSTGRRPVSRMSYLSSNANDAARWQARFAAEPPLFRVGLVWAGQGTHQKDRHRSLSLADFASLGELPGVRFYSLQVGDAAPQAKSPPAGMTLIDWTDDLHDFADTAALITQLGLVISVDTAVCHLAGAMGKPTWVLLAFQPDWRWLLDRDDSPWYPATRLFRQPAPEDWGTPLGQVAASLKRFCAPRNPNDQIPNPNQ